MCEEPRKVHPLSVVCPLLVLLQVMFIENAFLLLASSWLFSMVSWDTVGIPAAVLCSFLIGEMCGLFFRERLGLRGSLPKVQVNAVSCRGKHHAVLLDPDFTTSPLSFCTGVISLVLYYRFLHPKSFEIFQSIRRRGMGGACMEHGSTLSLEEKVTPTFHRHATLSGLPPACLVCPSSRLSLLQLMFDW